MSLFLPYGGVINVTFDSAIKQGAKSTEFDLCEVLFCVAVPNHPLRFFTPGLELQVYMC